MTETESVANLADIDAVSDRSHRLVSSKHVEGTPVFGRRGEKIGTVHSLMIDKASGQVAYAVLSFGGFLGLGARIYPLPWSMLRYDPAGHGYALDIGREDVEDAPYMTLDQADRPRLTDEPAYRHWDKYI